MDSVLILGDGPLGRAVETAARDGGLDPHVPRTADRRPASARRAPWRRPDRGGLASGRGRPEPGRRARRRLPPVRHRHDRLVCRSAGRRGALARTCRGRRRRVEFQPRRRVVRPVGRSGGRAVRASSTRSIHTSSSGTAGRSVTARPAPPQTSPSGSRSPIRDLPAPTPSRSSRSGPGHRLGCTWSGSTPPARPSNSG